MSRRHRHAWGWDGHRPDRDARSPDSLFESPNPHRLFRSRDDRWVAGVIGGIAEYVGIRAFPLRLVTIASLFVFGPMTVLAYLIAVMALRKEPRHEREIPPEDRAFWRTVATEPKTTVSTLGARFRDLERRLVAMEATVATPEFELNRKIRDLDR